MKTVRIQSGTPWRLPAIIPATTRIPGGGMSGHWVQCERHGDKTDHRHHQAHDLPHSPSGPGCRASVPCRRSPREPLPRGMTLHACPPSPADRSASNSRSAPTIAADATMNHFTRGSPMSLKSTPAATSRSSASMAAIPSKVADRRTRTVASASPDSAGRTASIRMRADRQPSRAPVKSPQTAG